MRNNKDAYLILAHKDDFVFDTLLNLLDDEKNDIYIHMDKKNKTVDTDKIRIMIKKSNIYFVERVKCNWGGFSLVKAELNLLKESTKKKYRYYHLLSGQDLPLKNQTQIYEYFTKNYGKQFVSFQNDRFLFQNHIKYYYLFQEFLGRNAFKTRYGIIISNLTKKIQDIFNVHRNKTVLFQKGDQWFSITNDFAKYIVSKEKEITKIFKNTYCPDEIFIQTLLINSKYKDELFSNKYNTPILSIKRYIDWNRGRPYVWKNEDFKKLIESDALYARKFDYVLDSKLVISIKKYIKSIQ